MDGKQLTIIMVTAFITAEMSFIANIIFEWYERRNKKALIRKNIVYSLIADLESKKELLESRRDELGTLALANPNNYEFPYFPIRSDYFSIFDNVSSNIGYIKNTDLKTNIILTYSELKGYFDNIRDLEDMSKDYVTKIYNNPNNQQLRPRFANKHYDYANRLINEVLPTLLTEIDRLINALKDHSKKI